MGTHDGELGSWPEAANPEHDPGMSRETLLWDTVLDRVALTSNPNRVTQRTRSCTSLIQCQGFWDVVSASKMRAARRGTARHRVRGVQHFGTCCAARC